MENLEGISIRFCKIQIRINVKLYGIQKKLKMWIFVEFKKDFVNVDLYRI